MSEAQFWSIYFRLVDHLLGDTARHSTHSGQAVPSPLPELSHSSRRGTSAAANGDDQSLPASHAQSHSDNMSAWEQVQPPSEHGRAATVQAGQAQAAEQDDLDAYLKVGPCWLHHTKRAHRIVTGMRCFACRIKYRCMRVGLHKCNCMTAAAVCMLRWNAMTLSLLTREAIREHIQRHAAAVQPRCF